MGEPAAAAKASTDSLRQSRRQLTRDGMAIAAYALPVGLVFGQTVRQAIPQLNDLLELTGIVLRTDAAILTLELWAGELRAFVTRD